MKKFILKRDLPTWKSGEEFLLKEDGNLYGTDGEKEIMVYRSGTLSKFDILNNKEWLEEIPEKPNSVWDLKEGDDFYFIANNNVRKTFITHYEVFRIQYLEEGNVFLTKEEAEKELEKRKAIQKIKKYCWENDIDTEYESGKNDSSFYRRIGGDIISIEYFKNGNPLGYFSHENAQKILDNFKKELKIILN